MATKWMVGAQLQQHAKSDAGFITKLETSRLLHSLGYAALSTSNDFVSPNLFLRACNCQRANTGLAYE